MATRYNKDRNALFHGFPDQNNVEVKNLLSSIERTYLDVGTRIGKYKIIEEIDRGGMAVVYKANQEDLGREVALKVLPANITINTNFVERFLAEAHSIAQLQHPNIVTIYDVSVQENIYYLAMEYIPGKNLFYYLNQEKPKLVDVLEIVRKLAGALEYAHSQKILHRDLKLNNVIMRNNKEPILIDFGLAKVIGGKSDNLTKTGEIIGSPAYMAPERIFGRGLDTRSDVCSLGIMLYEMLTFKNPYLDPRSMVQTTKNVVEANPVPPRNLISWLPVEVESITLKAMRGEPEERYQNMQEFSDDIQRYQRGEPILAKPPSRWLKIRQYVRKRWAIFAIAIIILLFSGLIGGIIALQREKSKSRWHIAFKETFETGKALDSWSVHTAPLKSSMPAAQWRVENGALVCTSEGFSFLRLEQPFTTDIRIEFDVVADGSDLYNTGFFICGNSPDNGYRFTIHRPGDWHNGGFLPGTNHLFFQYDQASFPYDSRYRVVIEKKDHVVSFLLNDIVVSRLYDFFPKALGKEHQKIGFFVNGGVVSFDNLHVYRRGVPRLARPTIIADRFWEQGDFEAALNEYREVLIDHSRSDIARQIRFKMADCLIRLGSLEEAESLLATLMKEKKIQEPERAKIFFLLGLIDEIMGGIFKKDSDLITLASLYPASAVNRSAAAYKVIRCAGLVGDNELDSAEAFLEFFAPKYPEFSSSFGRVHKEILARHIDRGSWNAAKKTYKSMRRLYRNNTEIVFRAHILLARGHLGRREKYNAVEVLNQCVGSMQSTLAQWHAWMILGEVYEYDHNYKDAFMIYQKIFSECPKTLPAAWMARLRMGELAVAGHAGENPETIFASLINEPHAFWEPRLIARLYSGAVGQDEFIRQWLLINPHSAHYLYHLARKARMDSNAKKALAHLTLLKKMSPPLSWDFVRSSRMIDDLYTSGELKKK